MKDTPTPRTDEATGSADGPDFISELRDLINRRSMENASNTPDFILAQYLTNCLRAWNQATQQRETWYGRDARPTSPPNNQECPECKAPSELPAPVGSASPVSVALLSLLTSASRMIKEHAPQLVKTTDWQMLEDAIRRAEYALEHDIAANTPNHDSTTAG